MIWWHAHHLTNSGTNVNSRLNNMMASSKSFKSSVTCQGSSPHRSSLILWDSAVVLPFDKGIMQMIQFRDGILPIDIVIIHAIGSKALLTDFRTFPTWSCVTGIVSNGSFSSMLQGFKAFSATLAVSYAATRSASFQTQHPARSNTTVTASWPFWYCFFEWNHQSNWWMIVFIIKHLQMPVTRVNDLPLTFLRDISPSA